MCSREPHACAGPGQAELGLSLLNRIETPQAERALIELVAFNLDAGLAADYSCLVATRRKALVARSRSVPAETLRGACESYFRGIVQESTIFKDVTPAEMCRPTAEIKRELAAWGRNDALSCD